MRRLLCMMYAIFLLLGSSAAAETPLPESPLFEASYLQDWLCRDWQPERWLTEFAAMKAAGFRAVILQSTVSLSYSYTDSSKPKTDPAAYTLQSSYALCPTALVSDSGQTAELEYALEAAAESGMQVWIGTVSDDRWWNYGWSKPDTGLKKWSEENAAACAALIAEIRARYEEQYQAQIAGYYYNNEIWNIPDACDGSDQGTYIRLLGDNLRQTIQAAGEKPVLVSPFYNAELSTAADYAHFLHELAETAGLRTTDIIAPQDGGGRDYTPDVIAAWAAAMQQSLRDSVRFWVNNETFGADMQPKSADSLRADYLATGCAQAHILVSWNHYYHSAVRPEFAEYAQAFSDLCAAMYGDINADGQFDAADAEQLCLWLTGRQAVLKNWKAGDLDGNGQLSAADLSLMKRALLT